MILCLNDDNQSHAMRRREAEQTKEWQVQTEFHTICHLDQPLVLFSLFSPPHFPPFFRSMLTQQQFPEPQRLRFITIISAQQSSLSIQMVQMKRSTCSGFHCCKSDQPITRQHLPGFRSRRPAGVQTGCLNVTDKLAGVWWGEPLFVNSDELRVMFTQHLVESSVCRTAAPFFSSFFPLNCVSRAKNNHPFSIYGGVFFCWGLHFNIVICFHTKYLFKCTRKKVPLVII